MMRKIKHVSKADFFVTEMKNCIFPQNGQYNIGWQYNKPNRNKNRFQWNKYTNGSYT